MGDGLLSLLMVVGNKGSVASKHEFSDDYLSSSGERFELIDIEQVSARS